MPDPGLGAPPEDPTDNERKALTIALLAATIESNPKDIISSLTMVTPADIRLLDAPTADCLDVALQMAQAGRAPAAVLLNAELVRRGAYDGHHGNLRKLRMIDAVTTLAPAVRLMEYTSAVLAEVVRMRMIAAADAIADRARGGAEDDAWRTFIREGAAVRALYERLRAIRGEAA
ncbi:hypothetical protein [Gordonia paraffinivorans]|uniref:hypothetical protein n=1 Tax=Gordonia paraffinivorans TaxID=175628 RepID=UPI001447A3B6|nr:hypothetical protein [Gordonia paraffinivorans]